MQEKRLPIESCNDDSWFNINHEFHQCTSRKIVSKLFGPANTARIQEPPSPKLPASVSKSRGKNYKIKKWEQRKFKAIPNKQHRVKNATRKIIGLKEKTTNGSTDKDTVIPVRKVYFR